MINRSKIFWSITSTLVIFIGMYIFLAQSSVLYRMSYVNWKEEASKVRLETRSLEEAYYEHSMEMTLSSATNLGFVVHPQTQYLRGSSVISMTTYDRGTTRR